MALPAGGSMGGMTDTELSASITDAATLIYNSADDKWEDNNVFGVDRSALQLDGGTF